MVVNKEHVQHLVDALRSDKYPQTHNTLQRVSVDRNFYGPGYCCLGVACVLVKDKLQLSVETTTNGQVIYDGSHNFMPSSVSGYYGFHRDDPLLLIPNLLPWYKRCFSNASKYLTVSASDANDTYKLNFSQIADAFERTYLKDNKYNKAINSYNDN